MPSDHTFRNLNRLHAWFAIASLLLLAATVWMIAADHYRPWREYQRAYRDEVAPRVAAELAGEEPTPREPPLGERVLRQPLVDALGRPIAVEQVYLPDLTIDYHFQRVARCDRCVTCHVGIAEPGGSEREYELRRKLPQPYRAHPRLDLFVGAESPHPLGEFGCTVCHDGQGSATDFAFASHTPNDAKQAETWRDAHSHKCNPHWEQPMLAARFAESRCVQCHHEVVAFDEEAQGRTMSSSRQPSPPTPLPQQVVSANGSTRVVVGEGSRAPKLLEGYQLVRQYGCFGCHEINGFDAAGRRLGPDLRLEVKEAKDNVVTTDLGRLRKVGPDLQDADNRMSADVLWDRIADPRHFLPNGRMPRLFGLHDHLSAKEKAKAERFEAVELRAIVAFVSGAKGEYQSRLDTELWLAGRQDGSAERGKKLFAQNGCVACHTHDDFPGFAATQGPDLSRVGLKYTATDADGWLQSWLRQPSWRSPRTRMPDPIWQRIAFPATEDEKRSTREADVAAYLMVSRGKVGDSSVWTPAPLPDLSDVDRDDLARAYGMPTPPAEWIVEDRHHASRFLFDIGQAAYRRRGCTGCHDGLADGPPIGPALSDWGRKHVSQLAFEKVDELLEQEPPQDDPDGFYRQAVHEQRREGFAWQKLRAPRSFDYKLAEKKPYKDWLRMGHFNFSPSQREAIITFLLSLTADPPKEKYVAQPDARQQALIAGRKVLDEFSCEQCHTFEPEHWHLAIEPNAPQKPRLLTDWPFLKPQFTPEQVAASLATDRHGKRRATVVGMPRVDTNGKLVEDEDDDGNPIRFFTLWQPALVDGHIYPVGGADLVTPKSWIAAVEPPRGGPFARWVYPRVLAEAKVAGATAAETEAWGWVPPPLVHEGAKVQPAWLYEYLLRPTAIRPAAVLRMPRFNLSQPEAAALVGYFAAKAGASAPYLKPDELPVRPFADANGTTVPRPFGDRAMKILTDRTTFCAKCHVIGDYRPGGENQTILAPDLTQVGRRLKPDYLRRWLANPKSVLPYTAMPVNFPPTGEPLGQDLFPGSSQEQLDAVVELLLHYDEYAREKMSVRKLIDDKAGKE